MTESLKENIESPWDKFGFGGMDNPTEIRERIQWLNETREFRSFIENLVRINCFNYKVPLQEIDDITQNVSIKISKFNGEVQNPRAWLESVVKNAVFDYVIDSEKLKNRPFKGSDSLDISELSINEQNPSDSVESTELEGLILEAVKKLKPEEANCLRGLIEGKTYLEIAKDLDEPITKVNYLVKVARQKFLGYLYEIDRELANKYSSVLEERKKKK